MRILIIGGGPWPPGPPGPPDPVTRRRAVCGDALGEVLLDGLTGDPNDRS
ncbi:MAG: hypothetical protein QOC67_135, partial [Pseudonocardiales bacterium]|nr:hypothetical protein [Pseudonocardiales bacterium]